MGERGVTQLDLLPQFDGGTFSPELDADRLTNQFQRVKTLMLDGKWRTLSEIHQQCGGSEAGISARVRDLRKARNGGYQVEKNAESQRFAFLQNKTC